MNDDAKKKILARRAKFVAAAIAGLGVACGKHDAEKDKPPPGPCLSVAYRPAEAGVEASDAGADAQPPKRKTGSRGPSVPCNCAPGDPLCSCL